MGKNKKVKITKNGPYLVSGGLPLAKEIEVVGESGEPETWDRGREEHVKDTYALCRCGQSKNMPYCDGTHANANFDGTETASHINYEDGAERIEGPELDLTDYTELCSVARFCHLAGGTKKNVLRSNNPKAKKTH